MGVELAVEYWVCRYPYCDAGAIFRERGDECDARSKEIKDERTNKLELVFPNDGIEGPV